jgi:tartrate/fumarate subfamily iron-sulfur-dependent hydro-lyase beta chain
MTTWHLKTPLSAEDVAKLKLMDEVYLTGKMWGSRDSTFRRHLDEGRPLPEGVDYRGFPILHEGCGYKKVDGKWVFTSGMGCTTSTRMERWMPTMIERHGCRAILGKGGLLEGTTEACKKYRCVYLATCGGAAVHYDSRCEIQNVYWPDLSSEAILELAIVEYGPVFVAIDAHGNNHYLNRRAEMAAAETLAAGR